MEGIRPAGVFGMGFVVVRCPGCRGASRVGPEAVGLLVICPRCSDPFLAVEEATPVAPAARPRTPPRPRERDWDRDRDRPRRPRPVAGPGRAPAPDPHDPHAEERGGLPLSVMVGLALLPFAIPLVWLIAPLLVGRPPALTVATPIALAVAAAALCLAVVFTVDWTPATRLKGVLVVLGLAYFAGLGLYFLRKEVVDRVGRVFEPGWHEFRPPAGPAYTVELPSPPRPEPKAQPLPNVVTLTSYRAARAGWAGEFVCVVGAGDDPQAGKTDDDDWFAAAAKVVADRDPGKPLPGAVPGREWRVDGRTVRLYRVNGVIYYLATAGPGPDADDLAHRVFESFKPGP